MMSDLNRDSELLESGKPKIQVDETWLNQQRSRLMGAIDQMESESVWEKFQLFFQKHILLPQNAVAAAMLVLGLFIGMQYQQSPIKNVAATGEYPAPSLDELLASDKLASVELLDDKANNTGLSFRVTQARHIEYSSSSVNDERSIALLSYLLNNSNESYQRHKILKKLDGRDIQNDLLNQILAKTLLVEKDISNQLSILDLLHSSSKGYLQDALFAIAMGDYPNPVRIGAIKKLGPALSNPHVHELMNLISLSDGSPAVRFEAAEQLKDYSNLIER